MIGWQCPGCNRCYAPFVQKCDECGPQTWFSADRNAPSRGAYFVRVCNHDYDYSVTAPKCRWCGMPAPVATGSIDS